MKNIFYFNFFLLIRQCNWIYFVNKGTLPSIEGDSGGGGREGGALSIFLQSLVFFAITFEELQTVLLEVELIINNTPLTCVYPNSIETCLKPNHLLFGRQLLYASNTTSTAVRNLTVLSSTTDKINGISNHFLDRWRHEHALYSKFKWDTMNIKIKYKLPKN